MPRLEIEATTEEMTDFREGWRCVRVDGRNDERSTARSFEAVVTVTECEAWRFRHLCNRRLLESAHRAE